jgi:hypothetical protein
MSTTPINTLVTSRLYRDLFVCDSIIAAAYDRSTIDAVASAEVPNGNRH